MLISFLIPVRVVIGASVWEEQDNWAAGNFHLHLFLADEYWLVRRMMSAGRIIDRLTEVCWEILDPIKSFYCSLKGLHKSYKFSVFVPSNPFRQVQEFTFKDGYRSMTTRNVISGSFNSEFTEFTQQLWTFWLSDFIVMAHRQGGAYTWEHKVPVSISSATPTIH